MIRPLADVLQRFRQSRGFGVQSPYAFRLITDIIRCPYAYYGYDDIDFALGRHPRPRRWRSRARLLLRLADFMRPESIFLYHNAPRAFAVALKCACPEASVTSAKKGLDGASFIVADAGSLTRAQAEELLTRPRCALLILDIAPEEARHLALALPEGVAVLAPDALLAVNRPGMARVIHKVWF